MAQIHDLENSDTRLEHSDRSPVGFYTRSENSDIRFEHSDTSTG